MKERGGGIGFRLVKLNVYVLSTPQYLLHPIPFPLDWIVACRIRIVCFLFGLNVCKADVVFALKHLGAGWETADLDLRGQVAMLRAHHMILSALPDGWDDYARSIV